MAKPHPQLAFLRRHLRLRHTELQHQRHKPLLSAVMQVTLDLATGLIARRDKPCARRGKLGIQLGIVERDRQLTSNQLHSV
jgi:hypothetical protein